MHALVVFGLVFTATVEPAQAVADLGDDPARFDQQVEAAYLTHDVVLLASVIADDALFTHVGGDVWTRARWLDAAGTHADRERTVAGVTVERHGDVIETSGHVHIRPDPAVQQEHDLDCLRIYVRREGTWQLVSHRTIRASGGACRAGYGVTLPRVVSEIGPQYTSDAMRARIQGGVLLECVVLTDGTVGEVRVIRSLDRENGLDDAAIRAAKQWRFTPGMKDCKPVPVVVTIEQTFTLGKRR